jgi:hypothetical protein
MLDKPPAIQKAYQLCRYFCPGRRSGWRSGRLFAPPAWVLAWPAPQLHRSRTGFRIERGEAWPRLVGISYRQRGSGVTQILRQGGIKSKTAAGQLWEKKLLWKQRLKF